MLSPRLPLLAERRTDVVSTVGKEPPVACAKLPQTDADIPAKPYDNYPQPDFTEFIAKQKANQQVTSFIASIVSNPNLPNGPGPAIAAGALREPF
jgi:hypothetical protein